jgi:hypothetical protein
MQNIFICMRLGQGHSPSAQERRDYNMASVGNLQEVIS